MRSAKDEIPSAILDNLLHKGDLSHIINHWDVLILTFSDFL